jgi:hypothetical protein
VRKSIFYFLFFLSTLFSHSQNFSWHSIPERQIVLNQLFSSINSPNDIKVKVKKFELFHSQVSLAEYKLFLNSVRKDSGELVYQSLLLDTNIGPKDVREKYFNSGKYDDYPVVGISWESALNYCKWLTVKNNPDSLQIIYRLPNLYEYYSAYLYLQSAAIDNNLNSSYADWLMDAKDESITEVQEDIGLSYYYFHSLIDPPVMKRKMVIGKSFLHSFNELEDYLKLSFYGNVGYRHIGFRIVKDSNPDSFLIDKTDYKYENPLLNYWNLKPKK